MIKKIRPALYRVKGSPWAWVMLGELAEIIGIEASKIVFNYTDLTRKVDIIRPRSGIVDQFPGSELYSTLSVLEKGDQESQNRASELFVPAGWALGVLKAVEVDTAKSFKVRATNSSGWLEVGQDHIVVTFSSQKSVTLPVDLIKLLESVKKEKRLGFEGFSLAFDTSKNYQGSRHNRNRKQVYIFLDKSLEGADLLVVFRSDLLKTLEKLLEAGSES